MEFIWELLYDTADAGSIMTVSLLFYRFDYMVVVVVVVVEASNEKMCVCVYRVCVSSVCVVCSVCKRSVCVGSVCV